MSDHEWCRDTARDEAVRAAEDAAAVPAIQHRDLPEIVADLRERVARLEAVEKQAASTEAMRCMTKMRRERDATRAECERLRVAHLKAVLERDRANEARGRIRSEWTRRGQALHAAQQTIGALNARVAELEAAYSSECDARAQAHRELSDLAAAVRERESGEECDHSYAAQCREAAAARDRAERMMPAPAANAGGEPVAWGVRRSDGTWWRDCRATRGEMLSVVTDGGDANNVVSPLYAAPQPPPKVKVPKPDFRSPAEYRAMVIAAIRAAGGEVE